MEFLIIYSIPIFVISIAAEYLYGLKVGKNTYTFNDTVVNLTLGLLSRTVQFVTKFFHIGIYTLVYQWLWQQYENPFWSSWVGFIVGILIFDFFDYWLHRAEHESAVLWAAHVVHHQSPQYNLSVALRQVTTEPFLGFLFYLPMALLGIPPMQLAMTVILVLLYQFFLHTDHIDRLGWLEYVFNTPSNHRVHHAINDIYIDKNYGAVTMIWDRLFGTYQAETQTCRYGTVKPFLSNNPVWANVIEYVVIWKKIKVSKGWLNKFQAIVRGPGWTPQNYQDSSASEPRNVSPPYVAVVVQFLVIGGLAIGFLTQEDAFSYGIGAAIVAIIITLCGCLGALIERKINPGFAVAINLVGVAACGYLFSL